MGAAGFAALFAGAVVFDPGVVVDAVVPGVPAFPIGVAAGSVGSDVKGVGSGGNGFDSTLVTISFIPASDLL